MRLQDKTVLVTGVSGTLGDKIVARCLAEGAEVRGLIRQEQQIPLCTKLHCTPVIGDLTDRATLGDALKGVQIVIHAAAYLGGDRALAEASNVQGVQHLVDAALAAGVERFVHISTVSVYGHHDGEIALDESSELAFGHPDVYLSTKSESERIVQQAMAKGLPGVILRPGTIVSVHNSHWGDRLVAQLAQAVEITDVHPDDLTPWVHAENVAEIGVLAATHPAAVGEAYNAVDRNVAESERTVRMAQVLKKKLIIPDGDPIRTTYPADKIVEDLGYRPIRTFEDTMIQLEEQARRLVQGSG